MRDRDHERNGQGSFALRINDLIIAVRRKLLSQVSLLCRRTCVVASLQYLGQWAPAAAESRSTLFKKATSFVVASAAARTLRVLSHSHSHSLLSTFRSPRRSLISRSLARRRSISYAGFGRFASAHPPTITSAISLRPGRRAIPALLRGMGRGADRRVGRWHRH